MRGHGYLKKTACVSYCQAKCHDGGMWLSTADLGFPKRGWKFGFYVMSLDVGNEFRQNKFTLHSSNKTFMTRSGL